MKTAKEFLQNKYPQMRGEKWNSNEVINDEWIAQMMEEYAAQPKWISERPAFNEECLVICANEIRGEWDYTLFQIKFVEHEEKHYMGWLTADGEEYGDLADLTSQLYYVMPLLPTPPEK